MKGKTLPTPNRIEWTPDRGRGGLVLPAPGFRSSALPIALVAVLFLSGGAIIFSLPRIAPDWVSDIGAIGWILGVAFAVIGLACAVVATVQGRARDAIREQHDGLLFAREFGTLAWRRRFIPKRAVREIFQRSAGGEAPDGVGVELRTEDEALCVGAHLPEPDQRWLVDALKQLACR